MSTATSPRSYLVCASQRSGSTLLVESLFETGVAGQPREYFQYLPHSGLSPRPREWFAGVTDESVLTLLPALVTGTPDVRSSAEWVADTRFHGRTPNGIWGGKLMWNQVSNLLDRVVDLPERSGKDLRSAIVDVTGEDPLYVHVSRADVAAQAVSMWRAVQTEVWRGRTPPEVDARAEYHADGIAHLAGNLLWQEAEWARWFVDEKIEPLEIRFDDMVASPRQSVQRVLSALGLDPELAPAIPPLNRQGDGRSDDWIARYRADAERRGLPQ
ncbi:Stf0 family sulphotransferase [soil metagenome]